MEILIIIGLISVIVEIIKEKTEPTDRAAHKFCNVDYCNDSNSYHQHHSGHCA